ncbi:MAG: T9SS type A sorting domain-containing protein [Candidatus Kapaibacterium sp.]
MKKLLIFIIISISTFTATYSQSWEFFNTDNSGILSNSINSLDVNTDGHIYLSTNEGISILKNGEWFYLDNEAFKQGVELPYISVLDSIFYFSNGKINRIYKGTTSNWELYIENKNAMTLEVINHNYLLFSDRNNLYSFQNNSLTKLDNVQFINDILYRNNGEIWFGAIHDGYGLYKQGVGKIDLGEKYEYSEVPSLVEDKDNFIWFSDYSRSLFKLNAENNNYEVFDNTNTAVFEFVKSIYDIQIDSSNNIWALVRNPLPKGSTLLKYNHKEWKEYNIQEQLPEYEFFILNSFVIDKYNNIWIATIGNDIGLIKFNETTTSVETNENDLVSIYPNPASNQLTIDLQGKQAIGYAISDIKGNIVENKHGNYSGQMNINLKSYPTGTYIIELTLTNNQKITNKLMKE